MGGLEGSLTIASTEIFYNRPGKLNVSREEKLASQRKKKELQ